MSVGSDTRPAPCLWDTAAAHLLRTQTHHHVTASNTTGCVPNYPLLKFLANPQYLHPTNLKLSPPHKSQTTPTQIFPPPSIPNNSHPNIPTPINPKLLPPKYSHPHLSQTTPPYQTYTIPAPSITNYLHPTNPKLLPPKYSHPHQTRTTPPHQTKLPPPYQSKTTPTPIHSKPYSPP